jgi:hypothetical protein
MIFYSDCQGNFFQHHWLDAGKPLTKKAIGDSVMQSIAEVVQKAVWEGQEKLVFNQTAETVVEEEKKEEKESSFW